MKKTILILACLVIVGCASGVLTPYGRVVPLVNGNSRGTGFVVGTDLVMTVEHVHGENTWVCENSPTLLVKKSRTFGSYEDIVLLRVDWQYDPEDIFEIQPGGIAEAVITQRGPHPLAESQVLPGDSGSPAVNKVGHATDGVSTRSCKECSKALMIVYDDQVTGLTPIPVDWR